MNDLKALICGGWGITFRNRASDQEGLTHAKLESVQFGALTCACTNPTRSRAERIKSEQVIARG